MDILPQRPLKAGYDIIVAGSGSGGAAVARRLTDAGADVLLIEAGPSSFGVADIDNPAGWVPLGRGAYDWGHDYAPTQHINGRTIGIPRGRVLGGSSAINAMLWYRGNPSDYDAWEAAGAEGWSHADVLPYFRRAEDFEGGGDLWRGSGGPLRITRSPDPHPLALAMIDGAHALGVPLTKDPNGWQAEGTALAQLNIGAGRRWSSAEGYLRSVLSRDNLTICSGSLVTGLAFDGRRCIGIEHVVEGRAVTTHAATAVVLALGAIETPRLLMRSGIGDPAELARLSIPVRHALPGVGQNLQDHPFIRAINLRSKRPLGPVRDNGGGAMINWKTAPGLPAPNVHAVPIQGRSATPEIAASHDLSGDIFAIGTGLMRSRSRGFLRLTGSAPDAPLEIQPNFLTERADVEDLIDAVGFILEMAQTPAYRDWFDGFAAPKDRLTRLETEAFIRDACSTFFHTCGTAKMGNDELSVTDARLRVQGLDNLTIADASVIPIIPACNTHAPVTMIGERAADFLLQTA